MKRILTLVVLNSMLASVAAAQLQLQPLLSGAGLVQKTQLWNIVIINNTGNPVNGRIEMVLNDRQTMQEMMSAATAEFQLPLGSLMVNENKLSPVVYNYLAMEPDKNINALLPAGIYSICYSFVKNPGNDKREVLAEECAVFDVEPLSPPALSFPADSTVAETQPSQFSWMPPVPAAMLKNLRYEIVIAPILPSQKPAEAIETNIPFFSKSESPANMMTYPSSMPSFEKDKWYAWQVVARDDNNYAGKSEVWTFKVSEQSPAQQVINASPYVQLQKNGAGKTVAYNGVLRFFYFNQPGDEKVVVSVVDITDKGKSDAVQFSMPLVRGENYLQKDIGKLIKGQDGHLYMLTLVNMAGEKWSIMFEIKKMTEPQQK